MVSGKHAGWHGSLTPTSNQERRILYGVGCKYHNNCFTCNLSPNSCASIGSAFPDVIIKDKELKEWLDKPIVDSQLNMPLQNAGLKKRYAKSGLSVMRQVGENG